MWQRSGNLIMRPVNRPVKCEVTDAGVIISTKGHVYLTENIHTDHSLNNIFHGSMNVEVRDHIQYAPSLRRAVKIISHSNQITYSQIMIQVQYFQLRLHSRVRRQRNIQNVLMKYSSTASKPHCASSPQEFNNIRMDRYYCK